jgi:signal transduction histidine kinase
MLIEQAEELNSSNTLLVERQQQIEEQAEELTMQKDSLSQLNATKDKLFTILAHDLKNPFNTLLGFSELLKKNLRIYPIDKIEKQVNFIYEVTRDTHNLLDNLLQWSRAQSGIISFEPEMILIEDYLEQELKILNQQALRKNIQIEFVNEGEIQMVEADPNLLRTVMRNLISNAIKYSPQGGMIQIVLNYSENKFQFAVKDQGIGIPEEMKDSLFRMNEHQSKAGTAGEKGTGFGLLLCADFISRHRGKIWVDSERGKGCTFYFSVPYRHAK